MLNTLAMLKEGDSVNLSGSSLRIFGTVVEVLDTGCVRVRWFGSLACTTHEHHTLAPYDAATG